SVEMAVFSCFEETSRQNRLPTIANIPIDGLEKVDISFALPAEHLKENSKFIGCENTDNRPIVKFNSVAGEDRFGLISPINRIYLPPFWEMTMGLEKEL